MLKIDIEAENKRLRKKTPIEIIEWAISLSEKRIVTTSFGTYSSVLLSAISKTDKNMDVLWCDTGYNNYQTYKHANSLIEDYKLNISIYTPKPKLAFKYTNRLLPNLPEAVTLLPVNHPKVIDVISIKIIR